jgi:PAP2 superfamily C-terminal
MIFQGLSKVEVVGLRRLWNTQWVLVACMGAALFCVQVQQNRPQPNKQQMRRSGSGGGGRRTLFGVATRAVTTVAVARTVRTVSFVLTVLPSQVHNCYAQRFPPLDPQLRNDTVAWIMVGLQPRSHGGCNDLIISGHAVITSTLACVATSVAGNPLFSAALWTMVVMDYAVEIYEGFHYSVDMWLGLVLVVLLWRVLRPLEGGEAASNPSLERIDDDDNNNKNDAGSTTPASTSAAGLDLSGAVVYLPPALVTYIQLNFLPEATANFIIIGFVLAAAVLYVVFVVRSQQKHEQQKQFLMHYIQHVVLCLLVLALGVYL